MLSFHGKFEQTDRRTMLKQYAPDLSIQGHKKKRINFFRMLQKKRGEEPVNFKHSRFYEIGCRSDLIH